MTLLFKLTEIDMDGYARKMLKDLITLKLRTFACRISDSRCEAHYCFIWKSW